MKAIWDRGARLVGWLDGDSVWTPRVQLAATIQSKAVGPTGGCSWVILRMASSEIETATQLGGSKGRRTDP